jgi:hypothetical protein
MLNELYCCDQSGSGEYAYCEVCGEESICVGCGRCYNCEGDE